MPNLSLILSNPQVSFTDDEFGGRQGWRLTFEAHISNDYRKVELTTNEGDMKNLSGTVAFESTSRKAYKAFQKGSLTYWKAIKDEVFPKSADYLITLRMTDDDLSELVKIIYAGIPLLSVSLSFLPEDMRPGWGPDDSHKKWDNDTKPAIEIQGYTLSFGNPKEEHIVPETQSPNLHTDTQLIAVTRETARMMRYVLFILVGLIVAVILS
jgi:hypothetical protein